MTQNNNRLCSAEWRIQYVVQQKEVMPFCLLSVLPKSAVNFLKRLVFMRPVCECNPPPIYKKFKRPSNDGLFFILEIDHVKKI